MLISIFKKPIYVCTLVALISLLISSLITKEVDQWIKNIDYVFILSFWTYVISGLFVLDDKENKKYFLIGWVLMFIASISPFISAPFLDSVVTS